MPPPAARLRPRRSLVPAGTALRPPPPRTPPLSGPPAALPWRATRDALPKKDSRRRARTHDGSRDRRVGASPRPSIANNHAAADASSDRTRKTGKRRRTSRWREHAVERRASAHHPAMGPKGLQQGGPLTTPRRNSRTASTGTGTKQRNKNKSGNKNEANKDGDGETNARDEETVMDKTRQHPWRHHTRPYAQVDVAESHAGSTITRVAVRRVRRRGVARRGAGHAQRGTTRQRQRERRAARLPPGRLPVPAAPPSARQRPTPARCLRSRLRGRLWPLPTHAPLTRRGRVTGPAHPPLAQTDATAAAATANESVAQGGVGRVLVGAWFVWVQRAVRTSEWPFGQGRRSAEPLQRLVWVQMLQRAASMHAASLPPSPPPMRGCVGALRRRI